MATIMHTLPEYHDYEEYKNRKAKLEEIRALGIEPYPAHFKPTSSAHALSEKYEGKAVGHSEEAASAQTPETSVSGRLVLFRAMGKNAFAHIQDHSGRIQIMFNRDHTKVDGLSEGELTPIKFIEKKLDLGDIIGIEGHLFRTQKGELTLYAKTVTLLCKTLLPLPDKHSGIADKGVRYRKRWLDLIANPDVAAVFKMRSDILQQVRSYFGLEGFLEVETAAVQHSYGGAEARPFKTHLNALDQEMYLRISLEISLKKLIVGGFDRIFEISKVFRNEGIDKTHNPEFTMLEAYAAYWDYNDMMTFTENLFAQIALKLFGTTNIGERKDKFGQMQEIDLKAPWKRISMKESLSLYANIEVDKQTDTQLKTILLEKGDVDEKEVHKAPRGKIIAMLFEELVEHQLIEPHHIIDHPIETTPLCKLHRDPKLREEGFVERFETFILGFEFCNSYTELNDPVLQRKLLEQQVEKREQGDEEAHPMDEEFIEAICQGMPPTAGLGIGIDRMVMLFSGATSIRDVIYFPLMKPEE